MSNSQLGHLGVDPLELLLSGQKPTHLSYLGKYSVPRLLIIGSKTFLYFRIIARLREQACVYNCKYELKKKRALTARKEKEIMSIIAQIKQKGNEKAGVESSTRTIYNTWN